MIAGGVLLVAIVATGAWFWTLAREQQGAAIHAAAILRSRPAEDPQAPPDVRDPAILDLERALGTYPRNGMAPQTAYVLGNLRFAAKQYEQARAAYQVALTGASSGTIGTMARAGIAYAWEAEKKLPEATQAFEAALAALKPGAFYHEELLFDLARVQEQSGAKDAAVATYRRILKDVPRSARATDVRHRLAVLGAVP
jgi:tetratricopeptide (TPR) repeat protein